MRETPLGTIPSGFFVAISLITDTVGNIYCKRLSRLIPSPISFSLRLWVSPRTLERIEVWEYNGRKLVRAGKLWSKKSNAVRLRISEETQSPMSLHRWRGIKKKNPTACVNRTAGTYRYALQCYRKIPFYFA